MSHNNKKCTECKKRKPLSEFYKAKTTKDGLCCHCKACVSKYGKQHRQTEAGKATSKKVRKKYNTSEKGKAARRRHNKRYCNTEKSKTTNRRCRLKRKYDITPEQYDKMFKKQKGCCAICKKSRSNFKIEFAVDHDHQTGNVRSLLCNLCNHTFDHFAKYSKQFNQYLIKHTE